MITNNRVNTTKQYEISTNKFLSPGDKSKDTPSNSAQQLLKDIQSNLDKKAASLGIPGYGSNSDVSNKIDKTLGVYTNSSIDPCNIKNNNGSPSTRDLNDNNDKITNCGNDKLTTNNIFNLNIKKLDIHGKLGNVEIYSLDAKKRLKKEIDKVGGNLSKQFNLDKVTNNSSITEAKSIYKQMNAVGKTLKNKLDTYGVLVPCNAKDPYGIDFGLDISILANLLKNNGPCDANSILSLLQSTINSGFTNVPGAVTALSDVFKTSNDNRVTDKLYVLKSIIDTDNGNLSDKDKIHTKGMSANILASINIENVVSNSPASDYNNITSALDSIDYNWKTDKYGNPDLTNTKDNDTMYALSSNTTKTLSPTVNDGDVVAPDANKLNILRILANNAKSMSRVA